MGIFAIDRLIPSPYNQEHNIIQKVVIKKNWEGDGVGHY